MGRFCLRLCDSMKCNYYCNMLGYQEANQVGTKYIVIFQFYMLFKKQPKSVTSYIAESAIFLKG